MIKKFELFNINQIFLLDEHYRIEYPEIPWVDKEEYKHEVSKEFISKFTSVEMKETKGSIENFNCYNK